MKNVDLKLTILITFLCIPFVLTPQLNDSQMRLILGVPLVIFLPGYSFIAMLFPRRKSLDLVERTTLSFGLSIPIFSLLGFVLNYTQFGVRLIPVLITLSTVIISFSLIAWIRRSKVPVDECFRVPFERLLKFNLGQSRLDKALSIVLIASIIGACATLAYVVTMPKTGERFTEFYLLGLDGMASNYPTELNLGDSGELLVGVVNHEYENTTYRIVVNFNEHQIYDYHVFLIDTEVWETPFTFQATEKGENIKLEFILYKDQEIYRTLHLWVTVS